VGVEGGCREGVGGEGEGKDRESGGGCWGRVEGIGGGVG